MSAKKNIIALERLIPRTVIGFVRAMIETKRVLERAGHADAWKRVMTFTRAAAVELDEPNLFAELAVVPTTGDLFETSRRQVQSHLKAGDRD